MFLVVMRYCKTLAKREIKRLVVGKALTLCLFLNYHLSFSYPPSTQIGTKFCTSKEETRGARIQLADYTHLYEVQNLGPFTG